MKIDRMENGVKLYYLVVIIFDVILMLFCFGQVRKGFTLDFYSDAFYSSNCEGMQLFYSYGEGFSEQDSVIGMKLTKLKDGYVLDLSKVRIGDVESVRMDYSLNDGKKVTAQSMALKCNKILVKKMAFNDEIWNNCTFNDLEYIGNNTFRTIGDDPLIIFGQEVVIALKSAYRVFCFGFLTFSLVILGLFAGLEVRYRSVITGFVLDMTEKVRTNPVIIKIQDVIYHSRVMKVYHRVYPIAIIIIGMHWQNKGIDLRRVNGFNWNGLKVILLCTFFLWLSMERKIDAADKDLEGKENGLI